MGAPPACLGIIAGSKNLPLLVAREARAAGVGRIVAVAFEGETDSAINELADEVAWLKVGQLSKMIKAFRKMGARHCVMAGQVAPKNLFDLRPDIRAAMLLFRLKEKNAHTIFGAIGEELGKEGIELIEATPWLREAMPGPGFLLGRKLTREQAEDLDYAFRVAKEIARLEIGQSVVVKDGVVLAVEGFEGTDRCLERGGELAGKAGNAVAVKVAKPSHDMRFDIPCIGAQTIRTAARAGISVLGIEAGKTIILERAEVEGLVEKEKITIATLPRT